MDKSKRRTLALQIILNIVYEHKEILNKRYPYTDVIKTEMLELNREIMTAMRELRELGEDKPKEETREEVTGLGTRSTNRNFGNSGFSGGHVELRRAA